MVSRLHRAMLRDAWRLRGQVIAAGLVVACGIAAFVTMASAYASLTAARANYYAQYRFADVFAQVRRAPEGLTPSLRAIAGVGAVQTRVVQDVTASIPGLEEPATARLISLPEHGEAPLDALSLRRGRWPAEGAADEVTMSETFASANGLSPDARIGAVLNGRWKELRVVGLALSPEYVYEVGPAMVFPDNRRFGVVWMGREALGDAFDMKGAFNDVAMRLETGTPAARVIDALDRRLAPYGGTGAFGRAEQASHRFLSDELAEIRVMAAYVPALFLGVAAFLLYTLLSRMVSIERGRIGLLKSFGFSNARVGAHFLEFALLVVGIGLLAGIAGGIALGHGVMGLYRRYFHFPELHLVVPAAVVTAAALIALLAAAAGSAAAVRRAVRLPPAEAMRPEPPARFRAGLVEAAGLSRHLGPGGRLIVRNLARRPGRAAMSVLGVAAAVATVVLGRFMFDAVDHLMAMHFGSAQREDVSVALRESRGGEARYELERLPGVLRVETQRVVPVRLRVDHREKRTALLGVAADADLKRLIDGQRRRIEVPPAGLVLTEKLAEILGVRIGGRVTVEQLDGERASFVVPVVKLSAEPLGIGAYMDADALARALGEGPQVSVAYLEVDPAQQRALYAALKRMPAVGAVAIRAAMLASVREVMNRSFVVMTGILTAFAAVLVIGVVYNSARIALSERGNELASLRVLGFGRGEVAALLLGEQSILTILAIPLGCGLGVLACRALVPLFDRELFRLPFVLTMRTFVLAALVTVAAAVASAALVAGRMARLDLIAALKTRE